MVPKDNAPPSGCAEKEYRNCIEKSTEAFRTETKNPVQKLDGVAEL